MARGIETTGGVLARPKVSKKAIRKAMLGNVELRFLNVKRTGNGVKFYMIATNNGGKEVRLGTYPCHCYLYDDLANKYRADRACVGTDCETGGFTADDTIIPGVSIKMSVYFKDISPQASVGTLEMESNLGKVIFRNISIK